MAEFCDTAPLKGSINKKSGPHEAHNKEQFTNFVYRDLHWCNMLVLYSSEDN